MSGLSAGTGPAAVGIGGVIFILLGQTTLGVALLIFSGLISLGYAFIMKS